MTYQTRLKHLRPWLVALACAILCWPVAHSQITPERVLTLDAKRSSVTLDDSMQTLLETGPSVGIEAIASGMRGGFSRPASTTQFPLSDNTTLWIHLRLQRPTSAPADWILYLPLPYIDHATLYQPTAERGWDAQVAGDTTAVSQWTHPGLYPEFHLHLPANAPQDIYLQVRNFKNSGIPLRLATESARELQREVEHIFIGAVLGTLLLLMGYCILRFVHTEDTAEGWYAAYMALMVVVIAGSTGLCAQWLWPDSPVWTNYSYMVLPLLGLGATILFVRHMCSLEVRSPRLGRAFEWLGWACLPLTLLSFVLERAVANHLYGVYLVLGPLMVIAATIQTWRRANPIGKWLFLAYLPQVLAIAYLAGQRFGVLPTVWIARHLMVLAVAASVPLLLHALGMRSRLRLEAEERASALTTQDALTGLLIKPVFMTQLEAALERALHAKESSAVVMVSVVNHAQLERSFGPAVAEQCLLRAVVKLHRVLRDVDPAGRVDTARFGLILEGVSSRQDLSERMVGLIASGLVPLPGLQPEVTLQFHMACVMLNEMAPDAATVMQELGTLLDGISPRTRRPIRFVEPQVTMPAPLLPESSFGENSSGAFMAHQLTGKAP